MHTSGEYSIASRPRLLKNTTRVKDFLRKRLDLTDILPMEKNEEGRHVSTVKVAVEQLQ